MNQYPVGTVVPVLQVHQRERRRNHMGTLSHVERRVISAESISCRYAFKCRLTSAE